MEKSKIEIFERNRLAELSRISGLSYNTGVSLLTAASQKAQMVHNGEVQEVQTNAIAVDELWSFGKKTKAMLARRTQSRGVLDRTKLSIVKWLDSIGLCRQAY